MGCGEPGSGNLIVEGDNLGALKALLPHYKGEVKCIYIDPPYNTGNEGWAYNDNVNSPAIRKWLGETVGKEGETLDRHDRWLCMMYPRLVLLKEFLREDGSIFISLDDNEVANLRLIMDEIFGEKNFEVQIIIEANRRGQTYKQISKTHEHILCYTRLQKTTFNELTTEGEHLGYVDEFGPYSARELRNRNPKFGKHNRPNLFYPIIVDENSVDENGHACILTEKQKFGIEVFPYNSEGVESCWRWGKEKLMEAAKNERKIIYASKTRSGEWRIFEKYRKETIKPKSLWMETEFISEQGTMLLKEIGLADHFQFPKPIALIERILQIASNPGDLVLDSFAGSGTTGHAVLKMNAAAPEKEARRFILVEMESKIAEDITRERVKRVAEGYTNAKGEKVTGLGGGFRYVRLGEALFDEHGRINESAVRFADLARHVYFSETGEPLPRERISAKTPLLGIHNGRAVYLLYNGILKDKSVNGGNVLTAATLALLPPHDGDKVVYAAGCRFSKTRLAREGIIFKQTPYAIRTR